MSAKSSKPRDSKGRMGWDAVLWISPRGKAGLAASYTCDICMNDKTST